MKITRQRFININKRAVLATIVVYFIGVFTPVKYLNPGLIFAFGAGFFSLLHIPYFAGRPKLAAHLWLFSLIMTLATTTLALDQSGQGNTGMYVVTVLISLIPFLMLIFGTSEEKIPKKKRLKIVGVRTVVQCSVFMIWASVTSFAFIKGTRPDLLFWAMFHVFSVAVLPFLFGRVLCGWLCPNATMQDALFKNLDYRRPIPKFPKAIDSQSNTCAMGISGKADVRAPLMPATLLLAWFPVFAAETIFDLTKEAWWPAIGFMMVLMVLSALMPWRKLCTLFCFLSSYRGLAGHTSLWRIRYNKNKCRNCKRCLAEAACPFYINITQQDNEMPNTCCLCFSCMEACPFNDVLTYKRDPEEKARLKAGGKAA